MKEEEALSIGATMQDAYGSHYRVEKLLGKGGFGAVYLVSERRNRLHLFALKEVIDPSQQDRRRLLFERKVLKGLNHPALPRVYHVFEQEKLKRVYLLMEYIEGKDLEVLRLEQAEKRFPMAPVLATLEPIVDALTYLHQQEPPILHRDIKPANIIVPPDGGQATLVDFGTAKEYLPESTTSIFRYGTPGYAAIEQYSHESLTGIGTDIYGLGATLYTLLTGVKPLDAIKRLTEEDVEDALQPANVANPDIPQPVSQAIQRAMSIHYADRFSTIEEFWQTLRAGAGEGDGQAEAIHLSYIPDLPGDARAARTSRKVGDARLRKPIVVAFSLGLLALVVLGLGLLFAYTHPAAHAPAQKAVTSSSTGTPSTTAITFPYPPIASSYTGTISDISVANVTTKFYLVQVRQSHDSISGNFQGLGLAGSFTGTVTVSGNIHFVVKYGRGSMIFDGKIKVGGDIEGNFSTVDQQGRSIGEYGLWYARGTAL